MIKNFLTFVVNPIDSHAENTNFSFKLVLNFIVLYFFYTAINASVIAIGSHFDLPKIESVEKVSRENSMWISVMIIALVAPVIEEVAFRVSLRFSVVNLALSMGVFSFFIINKLPYKIFDSL